MERPRSGGETLPGAEATGETATGRRAGVGAARTAAFTGPTRQEQQAPRRQQREGGAVASGRRQGGQLAFQILAAAQGIRVEAAQGVERLARGSSAR